MQGPVNDAVEDRRSVHISAQGLQETFHVPSSEVCLWGAPVEVSNQGADVAGRVLFRALPLALPDVIYVPLETLRPWAHQADSLPHRESMALKAKCKAWPCLPLPLD